MAVDPLRLAIAFVPLASYALVLAIINLRRRPFLTAGTSDLLALGIALSGVVFVGPIELFRPEAATAQFGNYIWLVLVVLYWLCLLLMVLVARPRLVIYNISLDELHPVLAETAGRLDPQARWAGNHLTMPLLGIHLHFDSFDTMRNVSLVASGNRQNLDGWRRLAVELAPAIAEVRVKSNHGGVSLLLAAAALFALSAAPLWWARPAELSRAMQQIFAY